jgi:hypothetical protein
MGEQHVVALTLALVIAAVTRPEMRATGRDRDQAAVDCAAVAGLKLPGEIM